MQLLISEPPLFLLPGLASRIGVNEALFMQQLHFWLLRCGKERDGKLWVYNSVREWAEQFPFWSGETMRRTIESCYKQGLILTANYNQTPMDRTKWYGVNYDSPLLDSEGEIPTTRVEQEVKTRKRLTQAEKKVVRVEENTPTMNRIGRLFGRRETNRWTIADAERLGQIEPDEEEIALVEGYYSLAIDKESDYRRRDLSTLLNNWAGEVDRARKHIVSKPKPSPARSNALDDSIR